MIGLGSNRLSVCRRGGMSVTQAGKGGMEWLAGFRAPSWASPYSAQATAALKAQFPTQWPTIRDYGVAHPEIVGYMNAYAPEDAKIAYSLVEGIGWRAIRPQNTNSYFKPNYSGLDLTAYVRTKLKVLTLGSTTGFCGIWNSYDNFRLYCNTNREIRAQYKDGTYAKNVGDNIFNIHTIELGRGKYIVDDEVVATFTNASTSITRDYLVGCTMSNTPEWPSADSVLEIGEHYIECGNFKSWLVPFKRNNTAELLDMVSGNLATKVGSGFQIIDPS